MSTMIWKLFGALFTDREPDGTVKISLGRAFLVVLMAISVCIWVGWLDISTSYEIPNSLQTILMSLMVYVFGTKVKDGVRGYINNKPLSSTEQKPLAASEETQLKEQLMDLE